MKLEFFSTDFRNKAHISNFIKIHPVRAELFHAGGRTDRYEQANSRLSQFCKSAYKGRAFILPVRSKLLKLVHVNFIL